MTIQKHLKYASEKFALARITRPNLEAEILLSALIKKPREYILAHPEHKLTKIQISNLRSQITKRLQGWPIAHLSGNKEFYGLNFLVDKNVLIPRPETEMMIDEVLSQISGNSQPLTIVDVGTGSGCIAISLAKQLNLKCKNNNIKIFGLDISNQALKIAKKNSLINKATNVKFFKSDLLHFLIKNRILLNTESDILILANLPYLTPIQIKNSPSIRREPKLALDGGQDGLDYYRKLFSQIKKIRAANPLSKISLICEIDPQQKTKINQGLTILKIPYQLLFLKDYNQKYRFALIKI